MDTTTVLAELIDTTCGETSCDAVDSTESSIQADRNCKDVIEGSQLFILPTDDLLKQMKVDEAVKSILDKENVTFADFEIIADSTPEQHSLCNATDRDDTLISNEPEKVDQHEEKEKLKDSAEESLMQKDKEDDTQKLGKESHQNDSGHIDGREKMKSNMDATVDERANRKRKKEDFEIVSEFSLKTFILIN